MSAESASLFEPLSLCRESGLDHADQPVILERLFEKIERAKLHRLDGKGYVAMAGHDDHGKLARARVQSAQQLHAVDARHAYVRDYAAGLQIRKLVQENNCGIETDVR